MRVKFFVPKKFPKKSMSTINFPSKSLPLHSLFLQLLQMNKIRTKKQNVSRYFLFLIIEMTN